MARAIPSHFGIHAFFISLLVLCHLGIPVFAQTEETREILDYFPCPDGEKTLVAYSYTEDGVFLKIHSQKSHRFLSQWKFNQLKIGNGENLDGEWNIDRTLMYPKVHWSPDGQYFSICGVCTPRSYLCFLFRFHDNHLSQIRIPEFPENHKYIVSEDHLDDRVAKLESEDARLKFHSESIDAEMWKNNRLYISNNRYETAYTKDGSNDFHFYKMAVLQVKGNTARWLTK